MSYLFVKNVVGRMKRVGWTDRLARRNPLYYGKMAAALSLRRQSAREEIERWSRHRLDAVLRAAAKTKYGAGVEEWRELSAWPLLTKETVRSHPARLLQPGIRGIVKVPASTSGTTGVPLRLFRSLQSIAAEQAFIDGIARDMGLELASSKVAVLRGDNVKDISDRFPPFWSFSSDRRRMVLSSNHLGVRSVGHYGRALDDFKPDCLLAYPTSLQLLCGLLADEGVKLSIPYVVTSSEVLTESARRLAYEVLGCGLLDYYGQAERVAFAYGYGENQYYFHPGYAHVELRPTSSDDRRDRYDRYEIIGTPYWNLAMPLVRYCTGDLICVAKGTSERDLEAIRLGVKPFYKIEGRAGDYLLTRGGGRLMGIDHIPRDVDHVLQMQIIQETMERVSILVVPASGFCAADRAAIVRNARNKIPDDIRIEIRTVEKLERTKQGKTPFVIRRKEARQ